MIDHLEMVTAAYRAEFVALYDRLFATVAGELEGYAIYAEQMRQYFSARRRRIPILHRNGGYYLLSPGSERLRRIQ